MSVQRACVSSVRDPDPLLTGCSASEPIILEVASHVAVGSRPQFAGTETRQQEQGTLAQRHHFDFSGITLLGRPGGEKTETRNRVHFSQHARLSQSRLRFSRRTLPNDGRSLSYLRHNSRVYMTRRSGTHHKPLHQGGRHVLGPLSTVEPSLEVPQQGSRSASTVLRCSPVTTTGKDPLGLSHTVALHSLLAPPTASRISPRPSPLSSSSFPHLSCPHNTGNGVMRHASWVISGMNLKASRHTPIGMTSFDRSSSETTRTRKTSWSM